MLVRHKTKIRMAAAATQPQATLSLVAQQPATAIFVLYALAFFRR